MKDTIIEYLALILGAIMLIVACVIIYNMNEKIAPIFIFVLTLIGTALIAFQIDKIKK